ncbi:MAG: helix-hairpin-helix domain-containing protein [Longimicrobiaceae bacterium]
MKKETPPFTHRKLDLGEDLRAFAGARPRGWDDRDWESFLDYLATRGRGADRSGPQLERERLALRLERIEGLEPETIRALVDRYETLWSLRQALPSELAEATGVVPSVAERIYEETH